MKKLLRLDIGSRVLPTSSPKALSAWDSRNLTRSVSLWTEADFFDIIVSTVDLPCCKYGAWRLM